MSGKIRIALDAMGGDHGPKVVIPAAALALSERAELEFVVFGDSAQIATYLEAYPKLKSVCKVVHTDVFVANDERPSTALRKGKDSSMRLAIDCVLGGEAQCVVSAGNTGALMATAKLVFKCLPGIHRPAIAGVLPNGHNGRSVMLDVGANVVADAETLSQFAVLGACFARAAFGVEEPRVGILNIGSEDIKGHETLHQASAILQVAKFPGKYIGFVEGTDVTNGPVDVVVTDGFTGNVALKSIEGCGKFISGVLKAEFSRNIFTKIAYLFASVPFKAARKRMDPRTYNGALFLGLNEICIKSHGGADSFAFSRAILVGANMVQQRFNKLVAEQIEKLSTQEVFVAAPFDAAGGRGRGAGSGSEGSADISARKDAVG